MFVLLLAAGVDPRIDRPQVADTMCHTDPRLQIFHYVRSRELRAVTLLGRAFKYQLDCQEIWRQLYFLRFSTAFGKFKSWKVLYIQVRRRDWIAIVIDAVGQ